MLYRISIPIVAAVGAAAALAPQWTWSQGKVDPRDYSPAMMWWGGGWVGMMLGPLIMILVLAVVVAAVVFFVRSGRGPWQGGPPVRNPLDILKERFARGEIDKEEFEERRRLLSD